MSELRVVDEAVGVGCVDDVTKHVRLNHQLIHTDRGLKDVDHDALTACIQTLESDRNHPLPSALLTCISLAVVVVDEFPSSGVFGLLVCMLGPLQMSFFLPPPQHDLTPTLFTLALMKLFDEPLVTDLMLPPSRAPTNALLSAQEAVEDVFVGYVG